MTRTERANGHAGTVTKVKRGQAQKSKKQNTMQHGVHREQKLVFEDL